MPAFTDMLATLGSQDTNLNLDEVALRFFERIAEIGENKTEFVNATCAHMGVNTSLRVPWAVFRRNGHQFAIAQTMAVADSFYRRLGREYRAYNQLEISEWKSQVHGEQLDALNALAENLRDGKMVRALPEFALIQYYRMVRNRVIHRSGKDTEKPLSTLLALHEKHLRDCYQTIPSKFEDICYDDFILLTRAIKYSARVLNQACALTPQQILAFHLSRSRADHAATDVTGPTVTAPYLHAIRRSKGRENYAAALTRSFARIYVMNKENAVQFADALREFVKRDGSAKERRRQKELRERQSRE